MKRTTLLVASITAALMLASLVAYGATENAARAAFPGINGKIAFSSSRGGDDTADMDVFTISFRGENLKRLTNEDSIRGDTPSWSADGKKIVFISDASGAICRVAIHTMRANGTHKERVTNPRLCASSPAFSPSGRKIVFETFGLYTTSANGSNLTPLTKPTRYPGDDAPAWSPDGKTIAFSNASYSDEARRGLYTINRDGTNRSFVAAGSFGPDWSPDGTEFTYVCIYPLDPSNNTYNSEIHKGTGGCTEDSRLTTNPANDGNPAFSPGGGKIVFSSDRDGDYDLYIMDADGTDVRQLTNNPAVDVSPDWRPVQ